MSNAQRLQIGGETVTYGDCDNPQHRGKKFVSIGSRENHTTFIVSKDYATVDQIRSRGTDKSAWQLVAIAVTSGYWS